MAPPPIDELRTVVRAHADHRNNFFAAAALGEPSALQRVRSLLAADSLVGGRPVRSDLEALVETLAAADRPLLRELALSWPDRDIDDSPWLTAAWVAALRHLDRDHAAAVAERSPALADELARMRGDGNRTPIAWSKVGTGGKLAIAWAMRPLAHRALEETAITAADLAPVATGWLRVLRGRFELLTDATIDVLRDRLAVADPDPYEVALIVEAGRAKAFDLDTLVAERLLVWTEQGTRSWTGFEAILTLLTAWIVP